MEQQKDNNKNHRKGYNNCNTQVYRDALYMYSIASGILIRSCPLSHLNPCWLSTTSHAPPPTPHSNRPPQTNTIFRTCDSYKLPSRFLDLTTFFLRATAASPSRSPSTYSARSVELSPVLFPRSGPSHPGQLVPPTTERFPAFRSSLELLQ